MTPIEPASTAVIVIPAFNEATTVGAVVANVRRVLPSVAVVVIDDGSTDGTGAAALAAGARVITHPYNKGNGAAAKTALREIHAEHIVIIDADGQHPPEMIPKMLEALQTHDLVIGARTTASASSAQRRFANWVFCKLAGVMSGREIPDLTSGFRAMNRLKALEFIHLYPNGFSFPTTTTLSFLSTGYSVKFMPIESASRPSHTHSHIRPLRDGLRFLLIIVRISTMINPLRVFGPASVMFFLAGVAWGVRTMLMTRQISALGAFLIGASLNILFFGIVLDHLAAIRLKGRD